MTHFVLSFFKFLTFKKLSKLSQHAELSLVLATIINNDNAMCHIHVE